MSLIIPKVKSEWLEGMPTGFMYTYSNHELGLPEYLCLDVPRLQLENVAAQMRGLTQMAASGQAAKNGDYTSFEGRPVYRIEEVVEDAESAAQAACQKSGLFRTATSCSLADTHRHLVFDVMHTDAHLFLIRPIAFDPDDEDGTDWGSEDLAKRIMGSVFLDGSPDPTIGPHAVLQYLPPMPSEYVDTCYVEKNEDGTFLSRKLSSGCVISVDAGHEGIMLRGGRGMAHRDMIPTNTCVSNLVRVDERTARKMLMDFVEPKKYRLRAEARPETAHKRTKMEGSGEGK